MCWLHTTLTSSTSLFPYGTLGRCRCGNLENGCTKVSKQQFSPYLCTMIRWSQYSLRRLDPGLMLITRDATAQCCQCIRVMRYAGLMQMCKTPPKRELLRNKLIQMLWGMWKLARPLHWELFSTWLALFMSHDCHDIWHTPLFHITWLSWYTTYPAIYVTCLLWYTLEAVFMLRIWHSKQS